MSRSFADRLVPGESFGDHIPIETRGKFGRERLGQSFDAFADELIDKQFASVQF
jgi:hypothetical protein